MNTRGRITAETATVTDIRLLERLLTHGNQDWSALCDWLLEGRKTGVDPVYRLNRRLSTLQRYGLVEGIGGKIVLTRAGRELSAEVGRFMIVRHAPHPKKNDEPPEADSSTTPPAKRGRPAAIVNGNAAEDEDY